MQKWYEQEGEYSDVVISSRVRLARNLKKYPFSLKLSDEQASLMRDEVMEKLGQMDSETGVFLKGNLNQMDDIGKLSLVERYAISPVMAERTQAAGFLIAPDETESIMINEEDHLRIQSLTGSMNMQQALKKANRMDDYIEKKLDIAYHKKYGYLTACPTNVGTGMRASYMVFLPALDGAGKMNQLVNEAGKFGVTIRGMYGEGTKACASIYQISNQKTLGVTEKEIIEKLDSVVYQIIQQERKRREYILNHNFATLEDQIYRSYGVLKYARQLNAKDALTLLSQLKFGVETRVIPLEKSMSVFRLMMEIQPANLQQRFGKIAGSTQRDRRRAEYIQSVLPQIRQ